MPSRDLVAKLDDYMVSLLDKASRGSLPTVEGDPAVEEPALADQARIFMAATNWMVERAKLIEQPGKQGSSAIGELRKQLRSSGGNPRGRRTSAEAAASEAGANGHDGGG